MRLYRGAAAACAVLSFGLLASDAQAQRDYRGERDFRGGPPGRGGPVRWVPLGCQKVGFRVDRDQIHVGQQQGRFKAIRLLTRGGNVHILDLTVVYGNGQPDHIALRRFLPSGTVTGPLDLRGRERFIQSIVMTYQGRSPSFRRPTVCVEGLD